LKKKAFLGRNEKKKIKKKFGKIWGGGESTLPSTRTRQWKIFE